MAFMAALIPMMGAAGAGTAAGGAGAAAAATAAGTAAAAGAATAATTAAVTTGITASQVAMAATLLSAGVSTVGMLKQGRDAKAMSKFQAQQLKANAMAETAAGQRRSLAARRQSELLQSRALAVAGASGAGTLDPDVLNIISGLAAHGEEQFQAENFAASSQAGFMQVQAAGAEFEGRQAQTASRIRAGATMLSAAADTGMFFGRAKSTDLSNRDVINELRRNRNAGSIN